MTVLEISLPIASNCTRWRRIIQESSQDAWGLFENLSDSPFYEDLLSDTTFSQMHLDRQYSSGIIAFLYSKLAIKS